MEGEKLSEKMQFSKWAENSRRVTDLSPIKSAHEVWTYSVTIEKEKKQTENCIESERKQAEDDLKGFLS